MNAAIVLKEQYCSSLPRRISKREIEVLQLIAYEYTTKEIAQKLFVSAHTIDSHRKRLMEKWHVRNTAGLVRVGFERGILKINAGTRSLYMTP